MGDEVRKGCGPVCPRGIHDVATDDGQVWSAGAAGTSHKLYVSHIGAVVRQDHKHDQAAPRGGVSLFQRRGHALCDFQGNPRDVRRPALDGDRQHDVEYHPRQDHRANGGLSGRRLGRRGAGQKAGAGPHPKVGVHGVHPRGRLRHDRREQGLGGPVHEGTRALARRPSGRPQEERLGPQIHSTVALGSQEPPISHPFFLFFELIIYFALSLFPCLAPLFSLFSIILILSITFQI